MKKSKKSLSKNCYCFLIFLEMNLTVTIDISLFSPKLLSKYLFIELMKIIFFLSIEKLLHSYFKYALFYLGIILLIFVILTIIDSFGSIYPKPHLISFSMTQFLFFNDSAPPQPFATVILVILIGFYCPALGSFHLISF